MFTGNGRVFHCEWKREGYPHADHAEEELSHRHGKTKVEEQGPGIHSVWYVQYNPSCTETVVMIV